ncbi:MAG: phosphatidylserine decarboxylase family protein [Desulfovermiculus sp.]
MRRPSLGICPEGVPYMGMAGLVTLVFALLQWAVLSIAALVLTIGIVHFFRDPERVVPQVEDAFVSPADGRVLTVQSKAEPLSKERRPRISIFMNVFNVHVNRAPFRGRITDIVHHGGRFLRASVSRADRENERTIIRMEDEDGLDWSMVQIAGLIARRIVCWAEVGDEVTCGQRVGLIKFGSRVDLYLPEGYEVKVRPGDRVFAGQTIVARKQEKSSIHV